MYCKTLYSFAVVEKKKCSYVRGQIWEQVAAKKNFLLNLVYCKFFILNTNYLQQQQQHCSSWMLLTFWIELFFTRLGYGWDISQKKQITKQFFVLLQPLLYVVLKVELRVVQKWRHATLNKYETPSPPSWHFLWIRLLSQNHWPLPQSKIERDCLWRFNVITRVNCSNKALLIFTCSFCGWVFLRCHSKSFLTCSIADLTLGPLTYSRPKNIFTITHFNRDQSTLWYVIMSVNKSWLHLNSSPFTLLDTVIHLKFNHLVSKSNQVTFCFSF